MKPQWIDLGRTSLRYAVSRQSKTRSPATPPLVLVHEMGGSLETWAEVVPLLPESALVLCYDWRGSGHSERISGEVTLEHHVGDLAALLDALDIDEKIVLAGCAVGAAIAAGFAASHPSRTAGLVLMSPSFGITAEKKAERLEWIAALESSGLRAIAEESLGRSYPECLRQGRETAFSDFRARWLTNDPRSYGAIYRMLLDLDIEPVLAGIACPTLAVGGDFDLVRTPDQVRAVAERIVGSAFVRAPGGHHMPHQIPDAVARLITEFAASSRVRGQETRKE